ncbi:hypothetical protein [Curtobacterium sp. MCBA15_001]|uniref:hypothetical protein n=1 Tax=Curtobacterium sp. MCBA15_001 TaxID=1898731 RepID=UPI001C3122C8|nr:hypothetical protein [Curtobacterium sp. MCBA15_001]
MRVGVDVDDLDFVARQYDPQIAYAQSKTANSLFAVGVKAWARDPGAAHRLWVVSEQLAGGRSTR